MYKLFSGSLLFSPLCILSVVCFGQSGKLPVQKVVHLAEQQYEAYIKTHADTIRYPRSTNADGSLGQTSASEWTSGFFPGCLWYEYLFTGNAQWKTAAEKWTQGMEQEKNNKNTHDLGFMLYDSYGIGYSITKDPAYRDVLLQGARSLSTRFHPEVGMIRSWDNPAFHYPVIIDNLMNLEFLFWATKASGDSSFYKIAVAHADTDLKYRFRPDGSSYHVLDFDPASGQLLRRMTHQGYSDSSCWARGQAWGIYGYTVLYRETKDKRYLQRAIKAADYFLSQTDKIADHIPYWDFQAPDIPHAPRDASAAAVAASGMIELSKYAGKKYFGKAVEMLASLCSDTYLATPGTNNYFLLKHSTGHMPHHSEIDVPIVYADYYLLEALWRYSHPTSPEGDVSPSLGREGGAVSSSLGREAGTVWVADQGDGTYKNPILYADYSDPDAVRVGDDYYMTASSFNCIPGLPILHSKDLVNWTIIGHAMTVQIPEEIYEKPQHGNGVWAPAIRWNKGEFYIYYPDPDYGIYVVKAKNPAGPWSKPVLVVKGRGLIDPCPLFEEDGHGHQRVWLVNAWAGSRAEVNSLLTIRPLQPDGLAEAGEAKMVYDGHDRQPTLEGPKLYKRNGYYYILAPAGGVVGGWQLALRSRNIYGPYEEKIVMDQGTTNINGPHQGAWVDTKTGESWFLHFQDRGAYGRITHLQPMQWVHDWPVIGIDKDGDGKGEPVVSFRKPNVGAISDRVGKASDAGRSNHAKGWPIVTPQESDEFNGNAPGLQWQWHANSKITWAAEIPGSGYLRLFAMKQPAGSKNLWEVPNLLLQKLPAPDFATTARIRLTAEVTGKKAGLLVMGGDYAYLALQKEDSGFVVEQVVCKNADKGGEEKIIARWSLPTAVAVAGTGSVQAASGTSFLYCRVTINAPDALCRFSYSLDGESFTFIGEPFYAKPDKWIGAKVGLFCLSPAEAKNGGYADVDWFRIEPASGPAGVKAR
jgi:beta-xylosidase/rhamnogalacturonyl hydrolase YesR